MNRQGFIGDIPTYIIALFFMSIIILTLGYVVVQINNGWQDSNVPTVSKNIFGNFRDRFNIVMDRFYLILVIGYLIVIILLAYLLRSIPALAMFAILLLIIFGMVAVYLSNAFFDFEQAPGISTVVGEYSMMTYLAERLPQIIIIFGALFIIILYAKSQQSGSGI